MLSRLLYQLKARFLNRREKSAEQNPPFYGRHLNHWIAMVKAGDQSCCGSIFCVFQEENRKAWQQAAVFLRELLEPLTVRQTVRLCEQMSWQPWWDYGKKWNATDVRKFLAPLTVPEEKRAVLILASFHFDGFLRENAVRELADYDRSLPFILIRLNDWVPEVRAAAHSAFHSRLERLSPGELRESAPYAMELRRANRCDHGEALRAFYRRLVLPEYRPELEAGIASDSPRLRLFWLEALLNEPEPDTAYLARLLAAERSPHNRLRIFRRLLACEALDRTALLNRMQEEHFSGIRLCALRFLYDFRQGDCYEMACRCLTDRNATVREMARWIVAREKPEFDFAAFYRDMPGQTPLVAIAGLGETGTPEDANRLAPYLEDSDSGNVRAAIRAMLLLDEDRWVEKIMERLGDRREEVANEAYRQLARCDLSGRSEALKNIFRQSPYPFTRRKCAALLFRLPNKWNELEIILTALADEDAAVRECAQKRLPVWIRDFNRSFYTLPEEQCATLKQLLQRNQDTLPPKILQLLRFYLQEPK